ncbi:MAG: TetR/AcrR family transcriptional regulator [Acidimicrobiales bacterium]
MAVTHESDGSTAVSPRRGRPPDLAKRKAILDATREVLADVGYTGLTIDAVAQRANSNRVLVYRVWDSKVALVCDAIFGSADRLVVPDTGSLSKDLRQFIGQLVVHMSLPAYVKGAPGVTVEMLGDPALFRETWRRYVRPAEDGFAKILERGRERGEVTGTVDPWLLTRVVSGITTNLAQTERLSPAEITDLILATFVDGLVPSAAPT